MPCFFAPGHIKIRCLSYNVPNAQTLKSFGEKEVGALKRPGPPLGPQSPSPTTSKPTSGLPRRVRPAAAPRWRGPSRDPGVRRRRRAAGSAAHSERPRAPPTPGQRPGSAPFLADPNMASAAAAAARDDDTSPRRGRPGDRGEKRRKVSLLFSRPARGGRTTNSTSLTLPGAGGGEGPTPPGPERRARTLPTPQSRPPRVCAASSPRAADAIRTRRERSRRGRSQVTPPPL